MNYKFYIAIFLVFNLTGVSVGYSQSTASKDKMEAIKIGFLTEKIDLTPTQAAGFWPLYNEYSTRKKELKSKITALAIETKIDQLTEEQISQDLKTLYQFRDADLQLEKEYMNKFTKYISNRQVAKLYKAERDFVKILLKKLEEK